MLSVGILKGCEALESLAQGCFQSGRFLAKKRFQYWVIFRRRLKASQTWHIIHHSFSSTLSKTLYFLLLSNQSFGICSCLSSNLKFSTAFGLFTTSMPLWQRLKVPPLPMIKQRGLKPHFS